MTVEEHKARHVLLHQHFDELLADWIALTGGLPSEHRITDLMRWSFEQTQNPTDRREKIQ